MKTITNLMIDNELVYIKKHWNTEEHPEDADKLRNKEAKELRKQGYAVKSKKWDFQDLCRYDVYELTATKNGWEFRANGGWRKVNKNDR